MSKPQPQLQPPLRSLSWLILIAYVTIYIAGVRVAWMAINFGGVDVNWRPLRLSLHALCAVYMYRDRRIDAELGYPSLIV